MLLHIQFFLNINGTNGTNWLRDETVGDETVARRIKRPDTFYTTYEALRLFVVNLNSMFEYFKLDISRQKAFVFCTDILNTQNGKFSHPTTADSK